MNRLFISFLAFFFLAISGSDAFALVNDVSGPKIILERDVKNLRHGILLALNTLDDLAKTFPPENAQKLRKQLYIQKRQLNQRSAGESVEALLALFSEQLKQAHEINLTTGKLKGKPAYYLSVGMLAFYAITREGGTSFVWNKQKKRWQELGSEAVHHVRQLWRMEKRHQPHTWISLPVAGINIIDGKHEQNVEFLNTDNNASLFSEKARQRIDEQIDKIHAQLNTSALSLLLSVDDTISELFPLSVKNLQSLFLSLCSLLKLAGNITYITLSPERLDASVNHEQFLFIGPFTVISDKHYFYKSPESKLLVKAQEQPGLSLSLQADAVFHNKKTALLPIDPLSGGVLLKDNQFSAPLELLQNNGIATWILCILGIAAVLMSFIRLCVIGLTSWRISRQIKHPDEYRFDNPLGRMVIECHYEPADRWINIMHEVLVREKVTQKQREKRFIVSVFIVFGLGLLLTLISIIKAVMLSAITGNVLAEALIPVTVGVGLSVILLISHSLLIVCHRVFLMKLENSSWMTLFGTKNKR